MGYSVKILADSLGPNNARLTTWELTYPRMVHSEMLTHRLFSRNSASSRAIPVEKMIERVQKDPALPIYWGKNQAGMQAREELRGDELLKVKEEWLAARDQAVVNAKSLMELGLHKQIANRLLEPWMYITVILSATEFDNWFRLRCHPDAQPEIGWVAKEMKKQYDESFPECLQEEDWHLPLIDFDDYVVGKLDNDTLKKVSVARCARVSYLTHDGRRDYQEDVKLHDRLLQSGHMSPFEHVACVQPKDVTKWSGNFKGWTQYRETIDPNFTFVGSE